MTMSREPHKLIVVVLAGLAVMLMAVGCGEKETATPTPETKAAQPEAKPAPTPTVKVEPKPIPAPAGAFAAFQKAQQVPVARVPVVSAAPKLDGVLDDVYKKSATGLKFKFLLGGDAGPTAATTVYVLSTTKELFVFYNCESPDMDALLADVRDHDGSVWQDDSIEMFVDPTNQRQVDGYMHFAINALGTTYESKGPKDDADASWDPKMQVKTKVGKKAWTMELAIPFTELVKDAKKINRVWAINFNRMAYLIEGPEDTAWSPTGGTDSHVPSRFGCLWLDVGSVDNTKQ